MSRAREPSRKREPSGKRKQEWARGAKAEQEAGAGGRLAGRSAGLPLTAEVGEDCRALESQVGKDAVDDGVWGGVWGAAYGDVQDVFFGGGGF